MSINGVACPKLEFPFFNSHTKDHRVWGSMFGCPYFWKLPLSARRSHKLSSKVVPPLGLHFTQGSEGCRKPPIPFLVQGLGCMQVTPGANG